MAAARPPEQKVLEELLRMYRATTCLWNPSHSAYSNQVMRKQAIAILLEKYRELKPTASAHNMSKKLQNMRTMYRKERKRVVRSRRPTGETLYEPTLWYYPLMRFLDELDPGMADNSAVDDSSYQSNDNADEDNDTDHYAGSESPPHKKTKTSAVYIRDEVQEYEIHSPVKARKLKYSSDEEEPPYLIPDSSGEVAREPWGGSAGELFGRAMSTRLDELLPQQRYIAEKLISDVIFLGRLNKLKTGSTINVNDDSY